MKIRELAIHPIHRKLAEITFICLDKNRRLKIDDVTLRLIEPYLKQNLMIIQRLDELKNLADVVYQSGDTDWLQDICSAIEGLEDDLFIKNSMGNYY